MVVSSRAHSPGVLCPPELSPIQRANLLVDGYKSNRYGSN